MRVTNCLGLAAGTLEATYTASRAWAVKRDHAPSQDSASASLLDPPANVVVSCHQCGTSAADRAIDSSELRLTTDREGLALGVDFRWLRVKFPLDWKSGILRA